jgi:hypothetical protein
MNLFKIYCPLRNRQINWNEEVAENFELIVYLNYDIK